MLTVRNTAFKSGYAAVLRIARAELKHAIKSSKWAYIQKVQNFFQDPMDPRRMWQDIQFEATINFPARKTVPLPDEQVLRFDTIAVQKVLQKVNTQKAAGPDNFPGRTPGCASWKEVSNSISLSTSSPQGYVLSLLLFTLMTHDCSAKSAMNHILKYADDTAVANPGIKVKITQKALDYGNQLGIELLKQKLKEKIFEDWNGESTHAFFALNYTISKLRIETMEFPNTSLSLISGTGIKLSVENASAMAHADWSVETWLFKDSGSGAVFISGISLKAIVKVSQNVFGHLKLSLDSCKGDIDDMDIKLSQSYRLLYTYSTASVVTSLCSMLASNLCQQVNCVIQKINKNFNQYPVQVQIGHFAVIDYSLINSSTILESSIDLDLKGTVRPVGETTEPPFKPTPFVLLNENNSMFYIGISEYFLQSASLAYYISGAFTISAEQEEMLSSYFKLTTDTLNSIIPTISHIYAKPLPVIMNIRIIDAPVISLHDHKSILVFSASVEVLAKMPNSTTESMFTLNVTTKTHADLTIFDRTLLTTLCLNSFHISLAHSNVGLFEASLLDNFLSYILRTGIIPAANFELKDGFPLPVLDTMILIKPNIRIYEGFLLISTDIQSLQ
ncbi:BPI fold-containing family C protein [Crotalus tigris]|uniref:BPI fold-containing family C protein n=1 Tax=Crotalus tigris TaxID=88082 RepID=UPI00192F195E|nr:BPI fold-containing family C protein [Crotalus tigris]